ncbi:class I SAM-dependent methyltransferase [Halopelagius longus]|uniref:Class I SAM-dependent methyltransferase n=1 Tax=Halopelagius longus TaxID=1236180 RepID=A0A1H0ZEX8_9EURY|nr:class I SAM-dependent methyltransferase [Halopelagius longus]RDI70242.1 class I SAM-dependent methyltransferase [Halopelagius longus]SDQ25681.1 Methyltransferase domain-containing protein [Halopelagius longus]
MDADDVRRRWETLSGEYSPDYYAYYGPNETSERLREVIDSVVGPDGSVLELGCSAGRHLAHLREGGYRNLSGIDLNEDSFDVMAEEYPELEAEGTFYADSIAGRVGEFEDGEFDVVYSVETLQHVHPDEEWVFEEIARIADELVVTVENEGGGSERDGASTSGDGDGPAVNYVDEQMPLYYRNWRKIFTDLGLAEVETVSLERDTFRAFRRQ